jgi:methionine synthase I (cobalamin-dependent)
MKPFLAALAEGPILFDGAMGSLLYDRGVLHTRSYDELVLSQPELIARVHGDYLAAGAQVLETDTFGANRIALARHGLADQMAGLNKAAVKLAREVAAGRAYVAGAVGPTGVRFAIASEAERRRARMALAEQIDTLVVDRRRPDPPRDLPVDPRARAGDRGGQGARAAGARGRPAHVRPRTASGDGGLTPAEVAERLVGAGADVIGANCGAGPAELYTVASAMIGRGKPVIVQPNAGMPSAVEGRTIYVANPEHFGVFARRLLKSGVRAIGGCCGTTPAHIQAMLGAFRMLGGARLDAAPTPATTAPSITTGAEPTRRPAVTPLAERSRLGARIARGEFAVSVEITAPAGTDLTKTKQQVASCWPPASTWSTSPTAHAPRPAWATSRCAPAWPPRPPSSRSFTSAPAIGTSSAWSPTCSAPRPWACATW